MDRRLQLHQKLRALLGTGNVYFQPPESVKLIYPCIIYKRSTPKVTYADNNPYTYKQAYQITIIDSDPDSPLIKAMIFAFESIRCDTHYTKDNLNHDVFTVYY